jgi:hypothetical protein
MKKETNALPRYFYEDSWHTFNCAVINGLEECDDDLVDTVFTKFCLFEETNFADCIDFTEDEWTCFKKVVALGVDELGKDFFTEEELAEITELLEYT